MNQDEIDERILALIQHEETLTVNELLTVGYVTLAPNEEILRFSSTQIFAPTIPRLVRVAATARFATSEDAAKNMQAALRAAIARLDCGYQVDVIAGKFLKIEDEPAAYLETWADFDEPDSLPGSKGLAILEEEFKETVLPFGASALECTAVTEPHIVHRKWQAA